MEKALKNTTVKIITAVLFFGVAMLLASSTFAAEASNSNTGADSNNDASVNIENNVTIEQNNDANINNIIHVNANTGGNSASKNTGDGSVNTGDINGSINIFNSVNGNGLNSLGFDCDGLCAVDLDISVSNTNTGADSDNEASVNVENDFDITQNNNLKIDNKVKADLDTGNNDADKNTGDGSVNTGDINFDINITNEGNENNIGGPVDEDDPSEPAKKEQDAILPEEGKVLAAAEGLPVTGGTLPIMPIMAIILAGLAMRKVEETLRLRFLPEKS